MRCIDGFDASPGWSIVGGNDDGAGVCHVTCSESLVSCTIVVCRECGVVEDCCRIDSKYKLPGRRGV